MDPGSNLSPHKAVSGSKATSRDRAVSQKAQGTSHQRVNETRLCNARLTLCFAKAAAETQLLHPRGADPEGPQRLYAEARGRAASQPLRTADAPDASLSLPGPRGLKLNPAAPVFTGRPRAEGPVRSPKWRPPIYQHFSAGKAST